MDKKCDWLLVAKLLSSLININIWISPNNKTQLLYGRCKKQENIGQRCARVAWKKKLESDYWHARPRDQVQFSQVPQQLLLVSSQSGNLTRPVVWDDTWIRSEWEIWRMLSLVSWPRDKKYSDHVMKSISTTWLQVFRPNNVKTGNIPIVGWMDGKGRPGCSVGWIRQKQRVVAFQLCTNTKNVKLKIMKCQQTHKSKRRNNQMEALWRKALHDKAKITQTHTYILRGQLQISDMF